ncbi:SAM and SH3 domain containing 1 [Chamberlinius hualienensis]
MSSAENIVKNWLQALKLSSDYGEKFIDNGYDDLEICKQIGEPDLDAIGVVNCLDRESIIRAVQELKERGGTAVYYMIEEANLDNDEINLDNENINEDDDKNEEEVVKNNDDNDMQLDKLGDEDESNQIETKAINRAMQFKDEYEEGKAHLANISHLQMKRIIMTKLIEDDIELSKVPYTKENGSPGYLGDLANSYARDLGFHPREVEEQLEELRWQQLEEMLIPNLKHSHPRAAFSAVTYTPGKYLPSSCLSYQEEDEIYVCGHSVCDQRQIRPDSHSSCDTVYKTDGGLYENLILQSEDIRECQADSLHKKKMSLTRLFRSLGSKKSKDRTGSNQWIPKQNKYSHRNNEKLESMNNTWSRNESDIHQPIGAGVSLWENEVRMLPIYQNCDQLRREAELSASKIDTVARLTESQSTHWYDDPPCSSSDYSSVVCPSPQRLLEKAAKLKCRSRFVKTADLTSATEQGNDSNWCDPMNVLHSPREDAGDTLAVNGQLKIVNKKSLYGSSSSSEGLGEDLANSKHDSRCPGRSNLVGRVRGFRDDVRKKLNKLKGSGRQDGGKLDDRTDVDLNYSVSSADSGSATNLLVSSKSCHQNCGMIDEEDSQISTYHGTILGKARALVDYIPSPYDRDALKLQKGDIIDVISMSPTGIWKGILRNKVGHFKFINVEVLPKFELRAPCRSFIHKHRGCKPISVEELLNIINLQMYLGVFMLNGYEELDLFKELEEGDLNYLGISDPDHRHKIMDAVHYLREWPHVNSFGENPEPSDGVDSGCYDSHDNLIVFQGPRTDSESGTQSSDGLDSSLSQNGEPVVIGVKHRANNSTTFNSVYDNHERNMIALNSRLKHPRVYNTLQSHSAQEKFANVNTQQLHRFKSQDISRGSHRETEHSKINYLTENNSLHQRTVERNAKLISEMQSVINKPRRNQRIREPLHPCLSKPSNMEQSGAVFWDLETHVAEKLLTDGIDLTNQPYSDQEGHYDIPTALVHRYADEFELEILTVAGVMDRLRLARLHQLNRSAVPNSMLTRSLSGPLVKWHQVFTVSDWLTAIGLPMYQVLFHNSGYTQLSQVASMTWYHFEQCGITNSRHLRLLVAGVEALRFYLNRHSPSIEVR